MVKNLKDMILLFYGNLTMYVHKQKKFKLGKMFLILPPTHFRFEYEI